MIESFIILHIIHFKAKHFLDFFIFTQMIKSTHLPKAY